MKNNRKVTYLLVALAIGIWGAIAHQLLSAADEDSDGQEFSAVQDLSFRTERYQYVETARDPFLPIQPIAHRPKRDTLKIKKPIVTVPLPALKLSGILVDKNKRTAIIEGADGSISFMHEQDTLKGVKILKIRNGAVSYAFGNTKSEWVLPR